MSASEAVGPAAISASNAALSRSADAAAALSLEAAAALAEADAALADAAAALADADALAADDELLELHPEITTVVLNINDRFGPVVLGNRDKVLFGSGTIEDLLCGYRFRISPSSFYQINPVQTEILYGTAVDFAALTGEETVLDAYCGIGTIGITASAVAKQVIGVELNREAVGDAIVNARLNELKNCWFTAGDAGEYMRRMAEDGMRPDVVFMDPPRAGSDQKFLSSLLKAAPGRIVYISCNPETLARDLRVLTAGDYTVRRIQPVDMFPYTEHCECVVKLVRRGTDTGRE